MIRPLVPVLLLLIAFPVSSPAQSSSPDTTRLAGRRLTKEGAQLGAVAGGISGGLFFLLLAAVADAEQEDVTLPGYVGLTALGVVLGGGAGALSGALIGSAFRAPAEPGDPRPAERAPPPVSGGRTSPGAPGRAADPRRTGRITALGAWSHFTASDSAADGAWVQATLETRATRWLALGPEVALRTGEPGALRLGGVVRLEPFETRVSPYLVGSLGANFWPESLTLVGGSAGVGARLDPNPGNMSFFLEARHHWNLQNAVEPGSYRFQTVGGGIALSW